MEFWVRIAKTEQGWEGFWPDAYQWVSGLHTYQEARENLTRVVVKWVADTWGNLKDLPQLVDPDQARMDPNKKGGWEILEVPRRAVLALTLKRARLGQKLSLGKVARRLDVPDTTYRRWEDPFKFNPTLETLEKIAHVLRVKLSVEFEPLDPAKYGTWQDLTWRAGQA